MDFHFSNKFKILPKSLINGSRTFLATNLYYGGTAVAVAASLIITLVVLLDNALREETLYLEVSGNEIASALAGGSFALVMGVIAIVVSFTLRRK